MEATNYPLLGEALGSFPNSPARYWGIQSNTTTLTTTNVSSKSRKSDNSKPPGWWGVKMSKPCTQKEAGKKKVPEHRAFPVFAAFVTANQAHTRHPIPTPTRGAQARTSVPSLPAPLHRWHRTCKGLHPGQPPWEQSGSEEVSGAHIQIRFITKQNQGQQKQEQNDPENTHISEYALQSISAHKENQATETTAILFRSQGQG